jgi:hypothetical protein
MQRKFRMILFVAWILSPFSLGWAQTSTASTPAPAQPEAPVRVLIKHVMVQKGETLELGLKDGSKIRGRVVRVGNDQFDVQFLQDDDVVTKTIGVADVSSIKPLEPESKRQALFLGSGIAAGAGVLTVIVLALTGVL